MREDKFSNTNKVKNVLVFFFQFEGHKTRIKDKSRLFGYIGLCKMQYVQENEIENSVIENHPLSLLIV